MYFSDLAHGAGGTGAEHLVHDFDIRVHVLRRSVEDKRLAHLLIAFEKALPLSRLIGQESQKSKPFGGKRRERERTHEGARTWEYRELFSRLIQLSGNDRARIGDDGHTRVAAK